MGLSMIVAMTREGVIGKDGKIPWKLSEDMKYFKKVTTGHPIIMGRKTWDSLPRKPLPDRLNIVMSKSQANNLVFTGKDLGKVWMAVDVPEAIRIAERFGSGEEPFVIGGAEIYHLFMPMTTKIYVTWVNYPYDGDTHFPLIHWDQDWAVDMQLLPYSREFEMRIYEREL